MVKKKMSLFSFEINNTVLFYSLLVIVFTINFFARFFYIDVIGLWYDESFSVYHSQASIQHILDTCKWDINPPGYLLVLHYWIKLFGISETAVRSLSLVSISLGTTLLLYICKKYLTLETGIFAVILLLVSKELFYYSLETRGYGLIFLLISISLWLQFKFQEKPQWIISIILGLLYGFMIYTHYLLGIFICIQVLFILFHNPKQWKHLGSFIVGSIVILFHWRKRIFDIFIRKTGGNSHKTWIKEPNGTDLITVFEKFFNNTIVLYSIIGIVLVLIGVIIVKKQKIDSKKLRILTLFFCFGVGIIVLHYFLSKITPMWVLRYFLYASIGLILFFAYLLSISPISVYIKYVIVLSVAIYSFISTTYTYKSRMNYKDGIAFVTNKLQDDDTKIIVQTIDVFSLFGYYYSKNLFTNTKDFTTQAHSMGIYPMSDTTGIYKFNVQNEKSIILTQTFENYTNKKRSIPKYLDSIFPHKTQYNQFDGIKITKYFK